MIKGRRYDTMRRAIEDADGVTEVMLDEDWHNPSGRAAYSPYDAVVFLEDTSTRWTKAEFEQLLRDGDVTYDEIKSFESDGDGNHKVFISLATGEEQGITASSD